MSLFVRIRQSFRALLFYVGFGIIVVASSFICCILAFLPFRLLQRITTYGNRLSLGWLRVVCNIHVKVTGHEHIPKGPCVILSNHQSTWDGFFMQWFFQPASMILSLYQYSCEPFTARLVPRQRHGAVERRDLT